MKRYKAAKVSRPSAIPDERIEVVRISMACKMKVDRSLCRYHLAPIPYKTGHMGVLNLKVIELQKNPTSSIA